MIVLIYYLKKYLEIFSLGSQVGLLETYFYIKYSLEIFHTTVNCISCIFVILYEIVIQVNSHKYAI